MRTPEEMYQYCQANNTGSGMTKKWCLKHFAVACNALSPDETPLMCFIGLHNYVSATKHDDFFAYVVTNKRLICAQKHLIGEVVQTIDIYKINDVTTSTGIMFGVITIDSVKEVLNVQCSKDVIREISSRFNAILADIKSPANQNVFAPASTGSDDVIEQLKKLKELVDMGVLTEEEFTAKKASLLDI